MTKIGPGIYAKDCAHVRNGRIMAHRIAEHANQREVCDALGDIANGRLHDRIIAGLRIDMADNVADHERECV